MITGIIALLFGIVTYVAVSNGDWGAAGVSVVIIVLSLAIGSASRECDRAGENFVRHWEERR